MSDSDLIRRRGYAAQRILSDPEIMKAFGEIEAELVTEWAATNPLRPEDRESIFRQVRALDLFQRQLETWRNNMALNEAKVIQAERDQRGLQAEA